MGLWVLITPSINAPSPSGNAGLPLPQPRAEIPHPLFRGQPRSRIPCPDPHHGKPKTIQKRPQIPFFLLLFPHKSSASELGLSLTPHLRAPARPFPSPAATWSLDNRDSGKPIGPGGAPPRPEGAPKSRESPHLPAAWVFLHVLARCMSKEGSRQWGGWWVEFKLNFLFGVGRTPLAASGTDPTWPGELAGMQIPPKPRPGRT